MASSVDSFCGSDPASADNRSICPEPTWYVASAAAHHMTGNLDLLNSYTPMSADLVVHATNLGPMQVLGSGSVNTANVDIRDVWLEEEISMDDFWRIVIRGGVPLSVVLNPWGIELHTIRYCGLKYSELVFALVEWGSSVNHPLVQSLLFAKNPVTEEVLVNSKAEEHAHSTSCVIVGKGNCARPASGSAAVSPEGVAACHVRRSSNASVDPPITPQEGRLICSAGEHPTTASSSRCFEVVIQIEPDWLLDSGASLCMTGNPAILQGLHDAFPVNVTAANDGMLWSDKCGRACGDVKLSGIRYFPGLALNLISAGFLVRKGCEIKQTRDGCTIKMGHRVIGKGRLLRNDLWSLDYLDGTLLVSDCTYCDAHHAD